MDMLPLFKVFKDATRVCIPLQYNAYKTYKKMASQEFDYNKF